MSSISHRQLIALAVPMILSNITVPLLGLVDTAVIGHLDHAYYLGGSSIGAMVVTIITWMCGFLRMSTTGLAAQAFGEKNDEESCRILLKGLLVAIVIASVFILFQTPYLVLALNLAGGSTEVSFYANEYAHIRIWGLPASIANMVIIGWLLGNHKAKSVMWLLIAMNLVNLVLDLLFVVYFEWQITGLAYATLTAEYFGFGLGLWFIYRHFGSRKLSVFISVWPTLWQRSASKLYFALNRDILIRTLALQVCFVFITFQGARLGDNVVAANAILMNFLLLISFGLDGIANAAEVLTGKAKGAKQPEQLRQIVLLCIKWTIGFAMLYSITFYVLGFWFISQISTIESVVQFANEFILWIVLLPLIACWSYLFDGIYIGLTQAKIMRNSMIISTFAVFFPSWWLLRDLGNHGLWAAFTLFMLSRGVTLCCHYFKNRTTIIE